ncbi:MAG: hypothetical protein NVS3B28_19860 [Candidatus Velthaea sp.]
MCTVRRPECVIDVDVAAGGKLACEERIVRFFLGVKAHVFEQRKVAVFERMRDIDRCFADAIIAKVPVAGQERFEPLEHRAQ